MAHEWYGRRPPERPDTAAWGARAILSDKTIYLLSDRQSWSQCSPDKKNRLLTWIDETGLPWLRAEVERGFLHSMDSTVLVHDHGGFHLEASPQRSGGYLYIGAWEIANEAACSSLFEF
jgi:hypothetical protein